MTDASIEDPQLTDILQSLVSGITSLDGSMVRPRWQQVDPQQPRRDLDWAALGVTSRSPENGELSPWVGHQPVQLVAPPSGGTGRDQLRRHEELEVLCSFYGPNADAYADRLRDGLFIRQNLEVLFLNGMGLIDVSGSSKVPELVNAQWLDRCDVTLHIRREVRRNYAVLDLLEATGTIVSDVGISEGFDVTTTD